MTAYPRIEQLEPRRLLNAGSVDQTFGDAGITAIRDPAAELTGVDIVALPDGGVVALSQRRLVANANPLLTFELTRLQPDGQINTAFGNQGSAITDFGDLLTGDHDQSSQARALATQPDGQIVAAGVAFGTPTSQSSNRDYAVAVARYHGNGTLDRKFASHGRLALHIPDSAEIFDVGDVKVLEDGKIVVAAITRDDQLQSSLVVIRLLNNGKLDPSFGEGGIARTAAGSSALVGQIAIAPDGGIVVVGSYLVTGDQDVIPPDPSNYFGWKVRFSSAGVFDASFGRANEPGLPADAALVTFQHDNRVAITPDGKVTVAVENSVPYLLRYNADGSPDTSFSGDGELITDLDDSPQDLAIQPDGKIVFLGVAGNLARFNSDGTVDASFGTQGKSKIDPTIAMALAPDGSVVSVGAKRILGDSDGSTIIGRAWMEEGPAARLSSSVLRAPNNSPGRFTVTYRDDDAVAAGTIDDNDIRVAFPDGSVHRAKLLGVEAAANGAQVAHYKFAIPGGAWGSEDNGDYSIRLRGRQVADSKGRFSSARTLGVFRVQIAANSAALPSALPQMQASRRRAIDLIDDPA